MVRLAKYFFNTKAEYYWSTSTITQNTSGLPIVLILGPNDTKYTKNRYIGILNSYNWKEDIANVIPVNIKTGKIHKRYLPRLKVSQKDLNQALSYIKVHNRFFLVIIRL